jgi:hypothetical protein
MGYDNITLTGTKFPHEVTGNTFALTFSNGLATPCTVQSTSTTTLVCLTSGFSNPADISGSYTMTIVINGLTVTNSLTFGMKDNVRGSSALTPSSVSPVLKTPIVISLDPLFPLALTASDFSVNATSTTNSTYVRYLNVLSVTDTPASTGVAAVKSLRVMFGGAYTGTFRLSIRHKTYGLLDTTTTPMNLVVTS